MAISETKEINSWASHRSEEQRSDNSDSIIAEIRSANGNNDSLYLQPSEGESIRGRGNSGSSEDFGTGFLKVPNNDGTNGPRYVPIDDNSESFFTTSQ